MKQFTFLGLETSGMDPARHSLISLSALRMGENGPQRFHTLLRPTAPLSKAAETLIGLTNANLSHAPGPAEAIRSFEAWRREAPIVLCRPEFDLPFLRAAYQTAGLAFRTDLVSPMERGKVKSALWKLLF